jgi:hypothetical protein
MDAEVACTGDGTGLTASVEVRGNGDGSSDEGGLGEGEGEGNGEVGMLEGRKMVGNLEVHVGTRWWQA